MKNRGVSCVGRWLDGGMGGWLVQRPKESETAFHTCVIAAHGGKGVGGKGRRIIVTWGGSTSKESRMRCSTEVYNFFH